MLRSRLYLFPIFALVIGLLAVASPWGAAPAIHAAGPAINSGGVSPGSGPAAGGNFVTISGTGFDPATNHTTVSFGPNQSTSVDCDVSGQQCTAVAPPAIGLTGAAVDVTITAFGSSATATGAYTYASPIITSVSPSTGPLTGGTSVTITGSNFTGATKVTFGTTTASFVVSPGSPDTTITATSPAGTAGPVLVQVTTGAGVSSGTTDATDRFTYVTATTSVTGISPNSGSTVGGNVVVISGSGFTGATQVVFDGPSVPPGIAASFTVNSDSQITAIAPPSVLAPPGTGIAPVTVKAPGGTSAPVNYTYTSGAPYVTGISPVNGPASGGTNVTISGSGFTGATSLTIGGVSTPFTLVSDTQLTATTLGGPAGTAAVVVTGPGGTIPVTDVVNFTYTGVSLTGVNPTSGPTAGGNQVTISGTNLTGVTQVLFGTISANFTAGTSTQLTATAPTEAAGPVQVTVKIGASQTSNGVTYTYGSLAAPQLTGVSPTNGPTTGGNQVTISGSNLTGATKVTFGANSANFTVVSDTQMTATAPASTSGAGAVLVTVTNGVGPSNTVTYTYGSLAAPVLTGVNPTSGPIGGQNTVTISGSNFTNATKVTFGLNTANFTPGTDTQMTATVPAYTSGALAVSVTVTNGIGPSNTVTYTYLQPTITGVAPATGPVGGLNQVTITGTGFSGSAQSLKFGANSANFTVVSDTQLTATVPPATGAGSVNVVLVTANGTATLTNGYTYVLPPKPTVSGVNPNSGSVAGSNSVTITGTGFSGGASLVKFGNNSASFTVVSDTQITATVPASTLPGNGAGGVNVTVTTQGTTSTNTVTYTYTSIIPAVTSIFPNNGPATGGTPVTISGSGFSTTAGATNIYFGNTQIPAANVNCTFSSQCSVTTPAGFAIENVTIIVNGQVSMANHPIDQFNYVPVVSSIAPTGGPTGGGSVVTINGAGFSTASGQTAVSFGGTAATNISCISQTQCKATSPAGADGPVDVLVTVAGQTSAISQPADQFTYFSIAMTLSGRTTDFTYTARTITVKVSGNPGVVCASTTQTYTNVFSIGLPTSCGSGAVTFFISGIPAGYTTTNGASCVAFTPGMNYTGMSLGTNLPINTSCYP